MAIFSRRDLQAALNRLASLQPQVDLGKIIGELNGNKPKQIIADEWEVMVLSAFSQCGRIEYEKKFGGTTFPDLFFQRGQSGAFEFLADITTISDDTIHKENPDQEFRAAIHYFLKQRGHLSGGLSIDVKHKTIGEYGDREVRHLLPSKIDINQFVKTELGAFLKKIATEPDKADSFPYNKNDICFTINYNPHERASNTSRSIDPTVPYSIDDNPLAAALKEKRSQLGKSGYPGIKGIIICDGGSSSLNERSGVNGAYGCEEIIGDMFRATESIHFVLVLRIEEKHTGFILNSSIQTVHQLYWNPKLDRTPAQETLTVIKRMMKWLPLPEATPNNAIHWLAGQNNKNVGRPLGGYSMQGHTIKISARALTELLAGKIELKQFLEDHSLKPIESGQRAFPFFEWQLQSGHTLKDSFVEPAEHKDDDWIVFEYAGPDPAIGPYLVPNLPKI